MPVFFAVVRDPVDRFASFFDYIRTVDREWGRKIYEMYYTKYYENMEEFYNETLDSCVMERNAACRLREMDKTTILTAARDVTN